MIYDLLGTADKEESTLDQRLIKLLVYLILGLIGEVNEHISAYNKVAARRIGILKEIMLLEFNPALYLITYLVRCTYLGKVLLLKIIRHAGNRLGIVKAGLSLGYNLLIKIGRSDLDLVKWYMS